MWGDQRVNCVLVNCVLCAVLLCKHIALYCSAMQHHRKQCAGADRGDIYIVYIQTTPPSVILDDRWALVGN
ncbi:unnamed protein product, partial [Staurois parvus]